MGRKKKGKERKLVLKIEDGDDPTEVYATTYQMRNFYKQMADGFFSGLDVMNYIQHHKAVLMAKPGDRVLDVCCGRGLLLPMFRWYRKEIQEYVGVDICEKNINEQTRRSGAKDITDVGMDEYYPFPIRHVITAAEDMHKDLEHGTFDLIVYTSSIEHMQKDAGIGSLEACYKLLSPTGTMIISCPNTMDKKDPYDTQYAAHLYEWDLEELVTELSRLGFGIGNMYGLTAKKRAFDEFMETQPDEAQERYAALGEYLPTAWLMAIAPLPYPQAASEVWLECTKDGGLPDWWRKRNKGNKGKKKAKGASQGRMG